MIAMAMARPDHMRLAWLIAHRLTHGADGISQGGLTDVLIGPHRFHQVVFRDDLVAVFEKVEQDLEDFGTQANDTAMAM